MIKKTPRLFLLSAFGIQLVLWISVIVIMKLSFCPEPVISEKAAVGLISFLLAAGGLLGIVFSAAGIYYLVLNNKWWKILWQIFLMFLPLLLISTICFVAFLMLRAII